MAWTNPATAVAGSVLTASWLNTYLRDNANYLYTTVTAIPAVKMTTYTATLANALNTVANTAVLTFLVPAAAMSDGDVIEVSFVALEKNNKGSAGTATWTANFGTGAYVGPAVTDFINSATEYVPRRGFMLQRVGTSVYIGPMDAAITFARPDYAGAWGTSQPSNFTGHNTVTFKVQLSAAAATFYVKPQSAVVTHFKN